MNLQLFFGKREKVAKALGFSNSLNLTEKKLSYMQAIVNCFTQLFSDFKMLIKCISFIY